MRTNKILQLIVLMAALLPAAAYSLTPTAPTFPKILGMQIGGSGTKNYEVYSYQQQLAKYDAVILAFYKGWSTKTYTMEGVVKSLKSMNPNILVGQYTILSESYDNNFSNAKIDIANELYAQNWWLLNAAGQKTQWSTVYNAYNSNYTNWTVPDNQGNRLPQWMAQRDYNVFFSQVPEFDIWYFDAVTYQPLIASADWKQIGTNQFNTDSDIQTAHRQGHAAEWAAARVLRPNVIQMVNNANNDLSYPEYLKQVGGGFIEGLMGANGSLETWAGWVPMMQRYYNSLNNTIAPNIVGFGVLHDPANYVFFRYSYASCLMNNGYYSFSNLTLPDWYSQAVWFDEYDVKLGTAIDAPPVISNTLQPYKRHFQYGMAIVNPTTTTVSVPVEKGYSHFVGTQDPVTNNGAAVSGSISMPPKSGIILVKTNN